MYCFCHTHRNIQPGHRPTLIALRGFRDIDGQLPGERVHAHHAAVGGARELGVSSRNAVERFRNVGRALQDYLLRRQHVQRE